MHKPALMLAFILIIKSMPLHAMPATGPADLTYVAREHDFDQVVVAITGSVEKVPAGGTIEVPVTVLYSMVDADYKPKAVKWMLPRIHYGGGMHFEANKLYILALVGDRVVWELSRGIEIKEITSPQIKLPLSEEELKVIRKKHDDNEVKAAPQKNK
jgi:hypothetical protein